MAAAVAVALLTAPAAQAFEFGKGELTGSLDTTVSYGISVRTEAPNDGLIGKSYFDPALCSQNFPLAAIPPGNLGRCASTGGVPGSAAQIAARGRFSANRDDGDVKWDEGDAFSNAFKVTSELSLKYRDWGAFTRATYFYDVDNTDRTDLTKAAQEKVGKDFRLLDAFIYHDFTIGDHKGSFRIGRQVVSWGESTFIQNGINVINPIDVSKLRVAGSELKEAFQPIDMLWGSFSFTENLSVEALYMLEFEEVEIDPSGTYFSSNDFASPGGTYVMLGFGTTPQPVFNPELYSATCQTGPGGVVNSDRYAQLVAMYTANPALIPAPFPKVAAAASAAAAQIITIGCGNAVARGPNRNAPDTGQYGIALHWFAENWGNTDFAFYFLNYHSRLPLLSGTATSITPAQLGAGRSPAAYANYYVEFPEDIQMYGISWNTTLPGGVAWQGEISHRPNMPLQVDDVELLFAALTPVNQILALNPATPPALYFGSQLGNFTSGQTVRGWRRHKVSQLQMTFTKAFGQALGSDQIALVGEVGATEVWDLPPQSELRYEGEGTDTGGGCDVSGVAAAGPAGFLQFSCLRNPQKLTGGFPTQFSWGYRVAAKADYNSVFGTPVTLSPRVAFNHDVNGITPGPGGNFLEGRKSGTLGVEANYLNKLVFDISYTSFFGGKPYNQIADRDFASFTVKYSF
ncbi:hypothetical protein N789_12755 [Arenimonas oryziterrae DSM 21050 = YC6267]|uniref:DUF1302 domain-containing protein n=1 Tax=Arenimonas oryziterrae DSM 21050 = YC6267 TaxID=1121015 RepID=A0A091AQR8_9GAMM|nr:hypothetical protein N789_12755 [Arenimonas oryziterrae DSM 21050 = YC6267]